MILKRRTVRSCLPPTKPIRTELVNTAISLLFSGEEAYGRYLDLYANHTMYNNLRHLPKRLSYLQYLDLLLAAQNGPVHHDLPQETRMTKEYEACVYSFTVSVVLTA